MCWKAHSPKSNPQSPSSSPPPLPGSPTPLLLPPFNEGNDSRQRLLSLSLLFHDCHRSPTRRHSPQISPSSVAFFAVVRRHSSIFSPSLATSFAITSCNCLSSNAATFGVTAFFTDNHRHFRRHWPSLTYQFTMTYSLLYPSSTLDTPGVVASEELPPPS